MRRALVLLLLALACCTPATWSRTDTVLEATFGATLAADYLQTRQVTADGKEGNPVMGHRGERMPPAVYFPAVAVAHVAAARCMPRPWRTIFQAFTVGWQVDAIHTNWDAGYAVEW